ncbi:MAG: M20/M25/M40 family metallo-hydrolase [Terriglobales bacterium]
MKIARLALLLLFVPTLFAQAPAPKTPAKKAIAKKAAVAKAPSKEETATLQRNIRAHMEFLASDALQGRKSASRDELIAGTYIAAQFRQFGVEPAGDKDINAKDAAGTNGYIQRVALRQDQFDDVPVLIVGSSSFTHGREMAIVRARSAAFSGPLQKLKPGDTAQPGAVAYVHLTEAAGSPPVRNQMMNPLQQGAIAVIIGDTAQIRQRFAAAAKELPELPLAIGNVPPAPGPGSIIVLNEEATKTMDAMADGSSVAFAAKTKAGTENFTYNVIGVLPGSDPKLSKEVILITAHMDHVGVTPGAAGDDKINNGADDDASGVIAVLEFARKLAAGPRPKRTVYFVAYGSEERGGHGSQFFIQNPQVPLTAIAANLQFEMIGRGDAAVPADTLWLTGYERTNLGPELAKQGAKIVADPHPQQNFFMRSDNYALARRGVVAQTVSSFGLHKEYHTPADDITHIDFDHMTRSIQSMFAPVLWLSNSTFKPDWLPGKKP